MCDPARNLFESPGHRSYRALAIKIFMTAFYLIRGKDCFDKRAEKPVYL